jgi:hypothetical protein
MRGAIDWTKRRQAEPMRALGLEISIGMILPKQQFRAVP